MKNLIQMKVKHLRSSLVSREDIILTLCIKEFMFIKTKTNAQQKSTNVSFEKNKQGKLSNVC